MIDLKELRIGNKVNHKITKYDKQAKAFKLVATKEIEIDEIDSYGGVNTEVHCDGEINYISPDSLEPIPLTRRVLERCGFLSEDMADLGIYVYLQINTDLSMSLNRDTIWVGEYDTKIKYLHQLQNLYHSLTGQELEYK